MEVLIEKGYAIEYDFGRGRGKYDTTEKGDEYGFTNLYKIVVESGLTIKPYKPRKA